MDKHIRNVVANLTKRGLASHVDLHNFASTIDDTPALVHSAIPMPISSRIVCKTSHAPASRVLLGR